MKPQFLILMVFALTFLTACQEETTVQTSLKLVEGAWLGTLDSRAFDVTFIEGEFEGDPTVSGSAHITDQTKSDYWSVGSATHNRKDTVWFCLYRVPNVTKEGYVLKGAVRGGTITGTYRQHSQNGDIVATGSWEVRRVP